VIEVGSRRGSPHIFVFLPFLVLWQPSLPDRYTKAKPEDLARDIAARRKQLGQSLVILGHHYQTDEVIQHADFIGDSLKLSQTAARWRRNGR
jgi:quinolinate synthase